MPTLWDRPDLVKSWKQKQNRRRRELAEEGLNIEVSNYIDVHNANTFRRAQALFEKTNKRQSRPVRYGQWDIELEKNLMDRDVNPETDTRSRHLRKGAVRTSESSSKVPSTVSTSPSLANGASGSQWFGSQTPSTSGSATLFSRPSSSRESQETLKASTPIAESRLIRPLPAKTKMRSPVKTLPSR